jgi:hypothetical protein
MAVRPPPSGGPHPPPPPRATEALGDWGRTATVRCGSAAGGSTVVRIEGPSPSRALRLYAELSGLGRIDRSASVRTEGFAP